MRKKNSVYKRRSGKKWTVLMLCLAMMVFGACANSTVKETEPSVQADGSKDGLTESLLTVTPAEKEQGLTPGLVEIKPEKLEIEEPGTESDGDMSGDAELSEQPEDFGPQITTITITAAGDCSLGNTHVQDYPGSFREMYDTQQNPDYFLSNVKDIFENDDFTIVNLEGTLTYSETPAPDRTYNIKGDPEYIDILTGSSVEAVSMSNNHRNDYGEEGRQDTEKAVKGAGLSYAYDSVVGIYETKGIRIGFVSVNEASQGTYAEALLKDGIAKLKEEEVDLMLACCHWGIEREFYPTDYQRELGQKCIDWGVDLVIGHHPHVLQGIEEYKGKYIIYSLANFCFGANRNPADKDTMIFQQTFSFLEGEKQEETTVQVIPCSVSSVKSRNDYCPTPAEGDEAKRILGRINEYSRGFGVEFDEEGHLIP